MKKYFSSILKSFVLPPETCKSPPPDSKWRQFASTLPYVVGPGDSEPVDFWVRNNATYDKLIPAVRRTFATPASNAPVERVFSYGGILLRPNRARMSTHFCLNWCF